MAACVNTLAMIFAGQGRYQEARPYFERAAELADDVEAKSSVEINLANLLGFLGDFDAARAAVQRALDATAGLDDGRVTAYVYGALGFIEQQSGDMVAARNAYAEALR